VNSAVSNAVPRVFLLLVLCVFGFLAYGRYEDYSTQREITRRVQQSQRPLFDRLGGRPAVEAVVDDFLGRLTTAPRFQRLFAGAPQDLLKKVRNHIVDQLCEVTGGPCKYSGRDMRTIHKGMAITDDDWSFTLGLMQASLDRYHVPAREQEELKAIIATTKSAIVE